MGIPRRRLFVPTWDLGKGRWSPVTSLTKLLLTAIDLALWIAVIFATAGPLVISGLTNMTLDLNVFAALDSQNYAGLTPSSRRHFLLVITSANLKQRLDNGTMRRCPFAGLDNTSSEPLSEISGAIDHGGHQPQMLLVLMDSQPEWATTVGYPLPFYIIGFLYASYDLQRAPPSADAPLALTFGIKWMIVVHVAIVSGCLLSNNNPSTASSFVPGNLVPVTRAPLPDIFPCRYQPVSFWDRGSNKNIWLNRITENCDNDATAQPIGTPCQDRQEHVMLRAVREHLEIGMWQYLLAILLPAITLTTLPYIAGAYLTYQTAPKGFGCLSLTLACYAGSQILVIFFHELKRHAPEPRDPVSSAPTPAPKQGFVRRFRSDIVYLGPRIYRAALLPFYLTACLVSLLVALGEPIMSAAGFYNHCRCLVNVNIWLHIDRAFVPLTFDYDSSPTSYGGWVNMGYVAALFMVLCTYASWYYQHRMKERYCNIVRAL
ncbi:beta-glucosidase [Oleoguttula sp. CCFEE 5521]